MVSCGRNERLNTVPLPELPPLPAVPYRVLPDKINPFGLPASYSFVKPEPSVLMANTVPAVPYRVWPDRTRPADGLTPSLPVKVCRVVKPVPSALMAKTVPTPELTPSHAVPYRVLPDKINPPGKAPSLLV